MHAVWHYAIVRVRKRERQIVVNAHVLPHTEVKSTTHLQLLGQPFTVAIVKIILICGSQAGAYCVSLAWGKEGRGGGVVIVHTAKIRARDSRVRWPPDSKAVEPLVALSCASAASTSLCRIRAPCTASAAPVGDAGNAASRWM